VSKIVGYARVSSREQAENSHALQQQIERLKAAGATEILSDVESGSRDSRVNFDKLLWLVESGQATEVVVTRLDRLTRSLPTLRKVLDQFQHESIGFRALDDNIDLSTAAGKFQLNVLGALSEMEVDRLSERVRHGWAHLRSRKVAMNPPFGYCKVEDQHQLDHRPFLCRLDDQAELSRAAIAREIIDTFLAKQTLRLTLRTINERYGIQTFNQGRGRYGRELFRFSPGGLRDWLTNPVLEGHICYRRKKNGKRLPRNQWEIYRDTHPDQRLISNEEVTRIEGILAHNKRVRGYGTTAQKYPLSGLVYCAECRSACYSMTGHNNYHRAKRLGIPPEKNYYFQCKNWRLRACGQKSLVRMEKAEAAVVEALMKRANNLATIADNPPEQIESPELRALREELTYYENAPGDRAKSIVEDLRAQIQQLQAQQSQQVESWSESRELLCEIFRDPGYWDSLSDEEKREIYRALVVAIWVKAGQVERVELRV
jgi:DNA invertase Pin-like site-specific DNA recombinase